MKASYWTFHGVRDIFTNLGLPTAFPSNNVASIMRSLQLHANRPSAFTIRAGPNFRLRNKKARRELNVIYGSHLFPEGAAGGNLGHQWTLNVGATAI